MQLTPNRSLEKASCYFLMTDWGLTEPTLKHEGETNHTMSSYKALNIGAGRILRGLPPRQYLSLSKKIYSTTLNRHSTTLNVGSVTLNAHSTSLNRTFL